MGHPVDYVFLNQFLSEISFFASIFVHLMIGHKWEAQFTNKEQVYTVLWDTLYYGLRDIKCRHCKKFTLEENFVNHRCYSTDQGFQDDVIARVEPGGEEVRSILCLWIIKSNIKQYGI